LPPVFPGLGVRPTFETTVSAPVAPPPVSGGTLLALKSGNVVVASDPDRDAIYVIDTVHAVLKSTITLQRGDEPGRLVEDGTGLVHVALRSGGALATIDPVMGVSVVRRPVCPAPRGVTWDSISNSVWVACATGELVALPAGGGAATKSFVIERDLRDVLVDSSGGLIVSEFRSAQILHLGSDGSIVNRSTLTAMGPEATAQVLWKVVLLPSDAVLAVHQAHSTGDIQTDSPAAYGLGGGSPFGIASSQMTVVTSNDSDGGLSDSGGGVADSNGGMVATQAAISQAVLPVDVAVSPDGSYAAVVSAGGGFSPSAPEVSFIELPTSGGAGCSFSQPPPLLLPMPVALGDGGSDSTSSLVPEQPIAVAFDGSGHLLVQMREPATLRILPAPACTPISPQASGATQGPLYNPIGGTLVSLSTISRADTGHDVFHAAAGLAIACASCHPEGGDDGHVWILDSSARRTPSLRGTIAGTAPYHWPGDEPDFPTLTKDVYSGRMGGAQLPNDETSALMQWVQAIPAPPAPSWLDANAVQRGSALFASGGTGCITCHSGPKFTNNQTMNVSTCGLFQVPPLVGVGWRAPFLHNGCAATLADRFGKCATTGHGNLSQLASGDVTDLVQYLESL
jgi:hypothetical protein